MKLHSRTLVKMPHLVLVNPVKGGERFGGDEKIVVTEGADTMLAKVAPQVLRALAVRWKG